MFLKRYDTIFISNIATYNNNNFNISVISYSFFNAVTKKRLSLNKENLKLGFI